MKTVIREKLKELEKEHGIKILYACESGSRAWGFPSPDSDYDVRFVYSRAEDKYLSVFKEKDFMDFPIDSELDINGWDIQKSMEHVYKSNSVVFEWLQSPIVYSADEDFVDELWQLCVSYFCPRTCIHHYLGIARGAMDSMKGDEIKIKKLFYVLRPLLSALWCLEKGEIAPMTISPLIDLMPKLLREKVLSLIDLKAESAERFEIRLDDSLRLWIDETFHKCLEESRGLSKKHVDTELLDSFFRKTIKG